jgi:hypothetical protein
MNYDLLSNNGEGHNMIDIKNIPIKKVIDP